MSRGIVRVVFEQFHKTYFFLDAGIEIIDNVLFALIRLIELIADAGPLSGVAKVVVEFIELRDLVDRVILRARVVLVPHEVFVDDALHQGRVSQARHSRRPILGLHRIFIHRG